MRTIYRNTLLLALALLVACAVVNFVPGAKKLYPVREGLDLSGGTRAVLLMHTGPGVPQITPDVQQQVVNVMQARVNATGVAEPVIQAKGSDQLVVEMPQTPGISLEQRQTDLVNLIQPAKLEFIWLKDVKTLGQNPAGDPAARYIYGAGGQILDSDTNKPLTDKEVQDKILYADPKNTIITGADLLPNGAKVDIAQGARSGVETSLAFDDKGAKAFGDFTSEHVGALLAIVLNGKISSAPRIESAITDGKGVITNSGSTVKEAQQLANLLNAGALPVPLTVAAVSDVEATLGQGAVKHAITGGLVGIIAVLLFMLAYYALPGVVAAIGLLVYAAFTFTVFRLLHVTLTLPGIAGFILSIGMAVDANILIFERMKEEMRAGRTLHAAVDAGFDRAWTSIRDSNISTLITCAVLYVFGTGPIRGFAFVLALGVLVSLLTAVNISRALLHTLVNQPWAQKPSYFRVGNAFGWGQKAERGHWDVMGRTKLWIAISVVLIAIGWAFNFANLAKTGSLTRNGIDFTGGSYITYPVAAGQTDDALKSVFASQNINDLSLEHASGNQVTVRTKQLTVPQVQAVNAAMAAKFGVKPLEVSTVTPVISKELTWNAVKSVIGACLLILLFLGFAFGQFGFADGLRYGGAAVIALVHDVAVIFGFMGLAGYLLHWEMSSLFVTAALTVVGFSVHDTIVVFDRIRENMKIHGKEWSFKEIANASILQTLGRSINTSFTVVLTLACLLAFGTRGSLDLRIFTSVLLVGIISGTYSSIFNATPILYLWEQKRDKDRVATASGQRRIATADTKTFATPKTPAATRTNGAGGAASSTAVRPGTTTVTPSETADRPAATGTGNGDANPVRPKPPVKPVSKTKRRF